MSENKKNQRLKAGFFLSFFCNFIKGETNQWNVFIMTSDEANGHDSYKQKAQLNSSYCGLTVHIKEDGNYQAINPVNPLVRTVSSAWVIVNSE